MKTNKIILIGILFLFLMTISNLDRYVVPPLSKNREVIGKDKLNDEIQDKPLLGQPSIDFSNFKRSAAREWTILVYIAGDNDLETFAVRDLNEMESIELPAEINVIVQIDRIPGYDTSNGDWTDTRRYLVNHDTNPNLISSTLLENLGELNMGDPVTLTDFLLYGIENYEANNYAVILWDHGGGIAGACWDESSSNDFLNLEEIESSLQTIRSGQDLKIDILGFDACLMATFEVAYQYQDYANILVASEDIEPGDGWPYDLIMRDLANNPLMTPEELATSITSNYGRFYENNGQYSTTLSAISLSKFGGFATEFKGLVADILYPAVEDDVGTTNFTDTFLVGTSINMSEKYQSPGTVDFFDLMMNFNENNLINNSIWTDFDRGFSQLVISNYHGQYHPNSFGLTIQTNSAVIETTKRWMDWTDSMWDEFIEVYDLNKQDPNYQGEVSPTIGVDIVGWIPSLEADPDINVEISLAFIILNQGTTIANGVQYSIFEYGLNAKETPQTIASATYGTLPADSYTVLTFNWTPSIAGWRIIELVVSTTSNEQETGNNRYSFDVWVIPDTGSVEAFIWLDTETDGWPAEGNTIKIYYELTNWGASNIDGIGNVTIWAYDWNNSIFHHVTSTLFSLDSYYYLTDYVSYTMPTGGYYYFVVEATCPGDPYTEDDYDFYGIYVIPSDVDLEGEISAVDDVSIQGYETLVEATVYNWGATAPGIDAVVLLYAYSQYNESHGLDPWGYIDGFLISNLGTIYDVNYYEEFTFSWIPVQGGAHDLYLWVIEDYYNAPDADLYPDNDIDYFNTFVYSLYPDLAIYFQELTGTYETNIEYDIKFELWNLGLTDAINIQVELYDYISVLDQEVLIASDYFSIDSFQGWLLTATWMTEYPGDHIIRITVYHPNELLDDDNEAYIYVTVNELIVSETTAITGYTSWMTTSIEATTTYGTFVTTSQTTGTLVTTEKVTTEETKSTGKPTISPGFTVITILSLPTILIIIRRKRMKSE